MVAVEKTGEGPGLQGISSKPVRTGGPHLSEGLPVHSRLLMDVSLIDRPRYNAGEFPRTAEQTPHLVAPIHADMTVAETWRAVGAGPSTGRHQRPTAVYHPDVRAPGPETPTSDESVHCPNAARAARIRVTPCWSSPGGGRKADRETV